MRKNISILIVVLSCINFSVTGQEQLKQQLAGKKKLNEIMRIVTDYYKQHPFVKSKTKKEFEKDPMLWWKRFEYYHRSRLDENGEITNASKKTWEGLKEFKRTSRFNEKANKTNINYGSWSPIGPTSYSIVGSGYNGGLGRVNCVAFHPTNADIIYIGTPQGGVWKTTDGGTSWTPKADGIPSTGISGLVVGKNNPNIIYALTGDGDASGGNTYGYLKASIGVLKSTDGGDTWMETGNFPAANEPWYGYKLIADPSSDNVLFAATSEGIYRTINGGAIWTQVQVGTFTDIEYKPGDNSTMYAARQNSSISAFYRSTDFGQNWNSVTLPPSPISFSRVAIGVSADDPNKVYILAGPAFNNGGIASFGGLLLSTNNGATFTVQASTPNILGDEANGSGLLHQSTYDLCIEVAPDDHTIVNTGAINIWRSTNSGNTFTNSTHWHQPTFPYVHADIHNLAYNPLNGLLYCCSDGGISVSPDRGVNWVWISNGLQIMDFYHLAGTEADQNMLLGGTQDNGTNHRYTATNTYRHLYGADGFDAIIDFSNYNTLYLIANDEVNKTTNAGITLTDISPAGVDFFPTLAQHTTNPQIIFCGSGDIYKSVNGGSSWSNKGAAGDWALITCPSNDQRVYASDGTNTFRSDNEGNSFITISGNPGYPSLNLTSMVVDQSNSFDVFATFGGFTAGKKVFYSSDGGANWINISGSLPNVPAQSIAVDLSDNVYVGTDVGVFVRPNGTNDWQPFYNGLPKTPVSELVIHNEAGLIRAATFGRGVWSGSLYSACPSIILLGPTTNLFGYRFYQASNEISSLSTVTGGVGTEIFFKAGDEVILSDGFRAEADKGFFKAWIAPCGVGVPNSNRVLSQIGIASVDEIASEVKKVTSAGFQNEIMRTIKKTGDRIEVLINVAGEKEHVRLYIQNEEGEMAWMYKGMADKGVYRFMINTQKLKTKELKLKTWVGVNESTFTIN